METESKNQVKRLKTLRELANKDILAKIAEVEETEKAIDQSEEGTVTLRVMNMILERDFSNLTYLDSTFLRDILKVDLNKLCLYFCEDKAPEF